ncbi:PilW family protein [Rheinheimera sp. NSM]|uniref:PilW family protein n=1 Tax=Rheinheimera sp. NSM TaxID=3457884 RepID=UPI004035A897
MRRVPGFTLTELLIAMLLGMILMTLTLTAFSSLSRSARQTQQLAELQQNAQLAMSILQNELTNTGFWGGRSAPQLAASLTLPEAPAGDCVEAALDSGSFPQPAQSFVTLYARTIGAGRQLNCLAGAISQTELLQIKRLLGQKTAIADMRQNRFYLESGWQHSRFVDSNSPGLTAEYDYFPYQHLVFYLQQQRLDGKPIPVLMRKRLSRNQAGQAVISTDSVLDGVERMHFEFGIDADADGQLDYQLTTEQMSAQLWQQNNARIISLRYHLLLRARQSDPNYINQQRYDMGAHRFVAPGDHYRRLLVSSTIFFQNAVL